MIFTKMCFPLSSSEWPKFILHEMYSWMTLAKSWIEAPVPLLVVSYEKLKANVTDELQRICNFLDNDCTFLNSTCFSVSI